MEESIHGLKGLTKKDWEDWLVKYQDKLLGMTEEEKVEKFTMGKFYNAFSEDPRYQDLKDISTENKRDLYNYYYDNIRGKKEGWRGYSGSRWSRWITDLFDWEKDLEEMNSEELIDEAKTYRENQERRKEIDLSPNWTTSYVFQSSEDINKQIKGDSENTINSRLENWVEEKYGYDTFLNFAVKEAQKEMDKENDLEGKRKIFEDATIKINLLNENRNNIQELLNHSDTRQQTEEYLEKSFNLIFSQNEKYKLYFQGADSKIYGRENKIKDAADVMALINSDYENEAYQLVDDLVTSQIADRTGMWENLYKGFWGAGAKMMSVPMYLAGIYEGYQQWLDDESKDWNDLGALINDIVDNPTMRYANDIANYGSYNKEELERLKNMAIPEMQVVEKPEDQGLLHFGDSSFWGNMINQYGFTTAASAISMGTSLVANTTARLGKLAYTVGDLAKSGKTIQSLRRIANVNKAINATNKILGTGANISLTTGFEVATTTLLDKLESQEKGIQDIKHAYVKNEIINIFNDPIKEANAIYSLGLTKVAYTNPEGAMISGYQDSEGNVYSLEQVLEVLAQNLDKRFDEMIKLNNEGKELPEDLAIMKNQVKGDFDALEKALERQVIVGASLRQLMYGTVATTWKQSLLSGTVQLQLKRLGFNKSKFEIVDGKVRSKDMLPKFMLNEIGYRVRDSFKEVKGEFIEEASDEIAGDIADAVKNYYLDTYLYNKYEGEGNKVLKTSAWEAIGLGLEAGLKSIVSENTLDAGLLGAVSAGVGGVGINRNFSPFKKPIPKSEEKRFLGSTRDFLGRWSPLTWRSSITAGIQEGKQRYQEELETIKNIQEWLDNPNNKKMWDGASGTLNWMHKMLLDIDTSNEYMYRNDNLGRSVHDILLMQQVEDSEVIQTILNLVKKSANFDLLSEEEKATLIEEYKTTFSNKYGIENKSEDEIIDEIKDNAKKMLNLYDLVKKEANKLESQVGGALTLDVKESMIYGNILLKNLEERVYDMEDELSQISDKINSFSRVDPKEEKMVADKKFNEAYVALGTKGYTKKVRLIEGRLSNLREQKRKIEERIKLGKISNNNRGMIFNTLQLKMIEDLIKLEKKLLKGIEKASKILNKYTDKEGNMPNYYLSQLEIMNLPADQRAFILNELNWDNYSVELELSLNDLIILLNALDRERWDGRKYLLMIKDIDRAKLEMLEYQQDYTNLLSDPNKANLYANRLALKISRKKIQSGAKEFIDTHTNMDYDRFSRDLDIALKGMSESLLDLFLNTMLSSKDPNVRKKKKQIETLRDINNFINNNSSTYIDLDNLLTYVNNDMFNAIVNQVLNKGIDIKDLAKALSFLDSSEYSGIANDSEEAKIEKDLIKNYASIMSEYLKEKEKQEKAKKTSQPKKNNTPKESKKTASEKEKEASKEAFPNVEFKAEKKPEVTLALSDEIILNSYKDLPKSVISAAKLMLAAIGNPDALGISDKSRNYIRKVILDLSKKSFLNKKEFVDALYQAFKLNASIDSLDIMEAKALGENYTAVIENTRESKEEITSEESLTNEEGRSESQGYQSSFGDPGQNSDKQGMIPMDIALLDRDDVFNETMKIMFKPYFDFWNLFKCGEFLLKHNEEFVQGSELSNKIFFVSNITVPDGKGGTTTLVEQLKQSFKDAGQEYNSKIDKPIIAVVESDEGLINIDGKNYLPISIFPSTGSVVSGSNNLEIFRDLAKDEPNTLIKDADDKPLLPAKNAPLYGNLNSIRGKHPFEKDALVKVLEIFENDMTPEEKEILENGSEDLKKTLWESIRDKFLNGLRVIEENGLKILNYVSNDNLKGEEAVSLILTEYIWDSVNSEGNALNDSVDLINFNSRTREFFKTFEERVTRIYNSSERESLKKSGKEPKKSITELILNNIVKVNNEWTLKSDVKKLIDTQLDYLLKDLLKYIKFPEGWELLVKVTSNSDYLLYLLDKYDESNNIILYDTLMMVDDYPLRLIFFTGEKDAEGKPIFRKRESTNGEEMPFAIWTVDYNIMTKTVESENLPKDTLEFIRRTIFDDGILFSRRHSFKYTPTGVKLNSPFAPKSKQLTKSPEEVVLPKKTTEPEKGKADNPIKSTEGEKKPNPSLVLSIVNTLDKLKLKCEAFRNHPNPSLRGISRILDADVSNLKVEISRGNIENPIELGITQAGTKVSYNGKLIMLQSNTGNNIILTLGMDLNTSYNRFIVPYIISNVEEIETILGTPINSLTDLDRNVKESLRLLGVNILTMKDPSATIPSNEVAAKCIGNTLDVLVRDFFGGKFNSLLKNIPSDAVKEILFIKNSDSLKYDNMDNAQVLEVVKLLDLFKRSMPGYTFYSSEVLLEGQLVISNKFKLSLTVDLIGIPDIIAIDPFGNIVIIDTKTFLNPISGARKERYYKQLSLYAKLAANSLGVNLNTIRIALLPIKVNYPTPKVKKVEGKYKEIETFIKKDKKSNLVIIKDSNGFPRKLVLKDPPKVNPLEFVTYKEYSLSYEDIDKKYKKDYDMGSEDPNKSVIGNEEDLSAEEIKEDLTGIGIETNSIKGNIEGEVTKVEVKQPKTREVAGVSVDANIFEDNVGYIERENQKETPNLSIETNKLAIQITTPKDNNPLSWNNLSETQQNSLKGQGITETIWNNYPNKKKKLIIKCL